MADEASDSSNKEQLPFVLRFVDKGRNVREEFVGFYECEDGVTGQAIATLILKAIQELGLSRNFCKGQCYDAAGEAGSFIKCKSKRSNYARCLCSEM